jgi:hypothetical protein
LENRVAAPPKTTLTPSILHRTGTSSYLGDVVDPNVQSVIAANRDIVEGSVAGQKRLESMKPAERLALLQAVKLDKRLHGLARVVAKEGKNGTLRKSGLPSVEKNRVTLQIWLNAVPPEQLAKLRALGFELAATLTANKLLLGTLPVSRLDDLVALPFVRYVELPKLKARNLKAGP